MFFWKIGSHIRNHFIWNTYFYIRLPLLTTFNRNYTLHYTITSVLRSQSSVPQNLIKMDPYFSLTNAAIGIVKYLVLGFYSMICNLHILYCLRVIVDFIIAAFIMLLFIVCVVATIKVICFFVEVYFVDPIRDLFRNFRWMMSLG